MSKIYYCHRKFGNPKLTCEYLGGNRVCYYPLDIFNRIFREHYCEFAKRYPMGTEHRDGLPQCPLNEHRCEFNVGDNECGRVPVCRPPKAPKPIVLEETIRGCWKVPPLPGEKTPSDEWIKFLKLTCKLEEQLSTKKPRYRVRVRRRRR